MQLRLIEAGTIEYEAMVALRRKVLLDPIGIPASYINSQKEEEDVLIGAFEKDLLIGCCILSKLDEGVVQLRQMVVNFQFQKKGVGADILLFAESLAIERGFQSLMLHARNNVTDFYKKYGYQIAGREFIEVGIAHHKMEKDLFISTG